MQVSEKMRVPFVHHPISIGIFHDINHPAIEGYPSLTETPWDHVLASWPSNISWPFHVWTWGQRPMKSRSFYFKIMDEWPDIMDEWPDITGIIMYNLNIMDEWPIPSQIFPVKSHLFLRLGWFGWLMSGFRSCVSFHNVCWRVIYSLTFRKLWQSVSRHREDPSVGIAQRRRGKRCNMFAGI